MSKWEIGELCLVSQGQKGQMFLVTELSESRFFKYFWDDHMIWVYLKDFVIKCLIKRLISESFSQIRHTAKIQVNKSAL